MRRVRITPGFWLAAGAVWVAEPGLLGWAAVAAGWHELGHLLALKCLRCPVKEIRLTLWGAELKVAAPLSYAQELMAALAGPVFSILLAIGAAWLHCYLLAGLSLALGLFNLLPVYPLDGGRALSCISWLTLPPTWAEGLTRWVSLAVAAAVAGVTAAAFLRLGGVFLLLPGLGLLVQTINGEKNT